MHERNTFWYLRPCDVLGHAGNLHTPKPLNADPNARVPGRANGFDYSNAECSMSSKRIKSGLDRVGDIRQYLYCSYCTCDSGANVCV